MTVFNETMDTVTPAGSDSPTEADDRIREVKAAVQERENVDHYWPLTGTEVSDEDTGEHRKVLFHEPIAATPTVAANHGDLRIKDVANGADTKAELVYTDEDEQEVQLTSDGDNHANDTYMTGNNAAGTGSVNLIKAGTNDLSTLPDSAEMASSAAPVEDEAIANKKYVDDNTTMVPAVTGAGTGYAGEESMTFANGRIMKTGVSSSVGGNSVVELTYGDAFPTAIQSIQITAKNSNTGVNFEGLQGQKKDSTSLAILEITNSSGTATAAYWTVWGY